MTIDPDRIADLLRALPPAPEATVRTAQELPFVRDEINAILDRASSDPMFRHALGTDAGAALSREGFDVSEDVVAHILRRLPRDAG